MNTKDEMKRRARELRKESTIAELNLWYSLRHRRLNGLKFHRQHVMGNYIVDFVCWEKKIIIEIDGGQHSQNAQYDEKRTAYLKTRGFRVLRYWNNDVLNKMGSVLAHILDNLSEA